MVTFIIARTVDQVDYQEDEERQEETPWQISVLTSKLSDI